MSDREALTGALAIIDGTTGKLFRSDEMVRAHELVTEVARKHLAQLPEKCGTCDGSGWDVNECNTCHGSGRGYPAELVEPKAVALLEADLVPTLELARQVVVAVLDVLNRETP